MKNYLKTFVLCSGLLLVACSNKDNIIPAVTPIDSAFQPTIAWSASVGNGSGKAYSPLNPVLVGNTLYVESSNGAVAALNATTGSASWQAKYAGGLTGSIGADSNRVVVGANNTNIIALNASTGESLWTTPLGNLLQGAPLVTNTAVVVKLINNSAVAVDPNTQKTLWTYQRQVPDLALKGGSAPILVNGQVIFGFDDGSVAALQLKSGNLVWEQSIANGLGLDAISRMVPINANLIASNGVVYAAAYQGNVAALDASSGNVIWQQAISTYAGFTLSNNALIICSTSGHVIALDKRTGKTLWRQDALVGRKLTAPAMSGNYVVLADNAGDVHWLNANNGQFVARINLGKTPIYATPVTLGNNVWIYNSTGQLVDLQVTS